MAWQLDAVMLNLSDETKALNTGVLSELERANKTPVSTNPYAQFLAMLSVDVRDLNPFVIAELEALKKEKGAGKNKYNAIAKEVDGRKFPSTKEANEYSVLRILERAGKIRDLELQPPFILQRANKAAQIKQVKYTPDFKFFDIDRGKWFVVETKGVKLADFVVRRNLFTKWLAENHPDWIYVVK